jgi:Ca2+-binding RTX toxin-like protein
METRMTKDRTINGTDGMDFLFGRLGDDMIFGRGGDDTVSGLTGNDRIWGQTGFDNLLGGIGNDRLFGGSQNDNVYGQSGNDILHGDGGLGTVKGSDLGSDNLDGGSGDDTLYQSDGNDTATLGSGEDTLYFKWQDPMIALAVGTGRSFTNITDFDPDDDRFVFDVAGLGRDATGANFIDGGNGTVGGRAASFFKGDTEDSNGESVMILTDKGFATGGQAVLEANNEATGDFIIYFNTTVNVGSLLFVDALDTAHSIARFANIDSLADLQAADFDAGDFLFA